MQMQNQSQIQLEDEINCWLISDVQKKTRILLSADMELVWWFLKEIKTLIFPFLISVMEVLEVVCVPVRIFLENTTSNI